MSIYSSIDFATLLEKATASTTVRAPVTTSPDANTPALAVIPFSSLSRSPFSPRLSPVLFFTIKSLAVWLMAIKIESA